MFCKANYTNVHRKDKSLEKEKKWKRIGPVCELNHSHSGRAINVGNFFIALDGTATFWYWYFIRWHHSSHSSCSFNPFLNSIVIFRLRTLPANNITRWTASHSQMSMQGSQLGSFCGTFLRMEKVGVLVAAIADMRKRRRHPHFICSCLAASGLTRRYHGKVFFEEESTCSVFGRCFQNHKSLQTSQTGWIIHNSNIMPECSS